MLSHVDDDHVNGLLDLLHELVNQRKKRKQETIVIDEFWHNSFVKTLGTKVERSMTNQMDTILLRRGVMPQADLRFRSIKQGDDLTASIRGLNISINPEFRDTPDRLVCVDNFNKPIQLANLKIQIVGPTRGALQDLQKEWEDWLAEQERISKLPKAKAETAART